MFYSSAGKSHFSHVNTNFRLAYFSHVISTIYIYISVSFMIHIFDFRKRTLPPYQPLTFNAQKRKEKISQHLR